MESCIVTIGIPVYNAEKYIRMAMDSALAQKFSNIEILVCDDCGSDSSIDIVKDYQKNNRRGNAIRIIRQPRNLGIGEARNRIIQEARGKYIFFLDADDTIEPNTIELLYKNAQLYSAEIVYASHKRIEDLGNGQEIKIFQFPFLQFFNTDEFAMWAYGEYDRLPANTWNFLLDLSVCRKNSLKFMPINYWEDFTFTMDLPTYITRAVLLPDITYHYYCRFNSASNFQKRERIDKSEILKTISAMTLVKQNSNRIKQKPYFHMRMYKVMKTLFFICRSILLNNGLISPPFLRYEIRDIMKSPLTFHETLALKGWRFRNVLIYILGAMPTCLSVPIIKYLK